MFLRVFQTAATFVALSMNIIPQHVCAADVRYELQVELPDGNFPDDQLLLSSTIVSVDRVWSAPGVEQEADIGFYSSGWHWELQANYASAGLPEWLDDSVWPLTRQLLRSRAAQKFRADVFSFKITNAR